MTYLYDKKNLKYPHNLDNPVIVDLGANLGLESIKLNKLYPNGKFILVEPQKYNCQYIRKLNQPNWELLECAIDNVSGMKEFGFHHFIDERLNGSLDPFNWERWNYEGTTLVECKTFDQICKNPDIIKIDIERHEYIVLPDICKNSNIQVMYIELHGPCYELDIIRFFDVCLENTGLKITGWYEVEQRQTDNLEEDFCKEISPQSKIECSGSANVIIERIL